MRKILIVSDSASELDSFLKETYEVQVMSHAKVPVKKPGDLILLDAQADDFSLCELLRADKLTQLTPILVLSESEDPETRARAFLAGADGYVRKPWHEKELLAQIVARLRRLDEGTKDEHIRCGNLVLNVASQEAVLDGELLAVSTLEFQILHYFMSNLGKLITRKALLDALWKGSVVSERTIDAHMAILRKKLGRFNYEFQTVYGSGYRLKPIQN